MIYITAIIRRTALERTVSALDKIGVRGITITDVRGLGEELDLYRTYAFHARLEVLAHDNEEERITDAILAETSQGIPGDGLIMSWPVKRAIRIRTGSDFA